MFVPLTWIPVAMMFAHATIAPIQHPLPRLIAPVIADSGTADTVTIALTDAMLTHYIAVKKDLMTYWKSHRAQLDSAKTTEYHPSVSMTGPGGAQQQMPVGYFNYPMLTAKNADLAAMFKKNNMDPQQFGPTQIAATKGMFALAASDASKAPITDSTSVWGKNITVIKPHRQELTVVGIGVQARMQAAGQGTGGDLNP